MKKLIFTLDLLILTCLLAACRDQDDHIQPAAITEVTILSGDLYLVVGETLTLECTVTPKEGPDRSVNWISLDPSVVQVDGRGAVTALAPGDTYILLNAADNGKITDNIRVNVRPADVDVTAIRIDEGDFSIAPGGFKMLTCTILPENASVRSVAWKSLDPSIAAIDERGKVTALQQGETFIVAVSTANELATDTVSVEVTDRTIPVTQVIINDGDISLNTGSSVTLSWTVLPSKATDKSVAWQSANEQVATVDQHGKVTATGVGETQITVTSVSDSDVSNTIRISVTRVEITGMTINAPADYIYNGYTQKLTCTVLPAHAAQDVVWSSSNPAVVSVGGDGLLRSHTEGMATISATSVDGSGSQTSLDVTVLRPLTGTYTGTLYGSTNKVTILGITVIKKEDIYEEGASMYVEQLDGKHIRVRKELEGVMYTFDCDIAYRNGATQITGSVEQTTYVEQIDMNVTVRAYVLDGSYIDGNGKLYARMSAQGKAAGTDWKNLFKSLEYDAQRED